MKETLKRLDVWCKIVLMLLFVWLYIMARSYSIGIPAVFRSSSPFLPSLFWLFR